MKLFSFPVDCIFCVSAKEIEELSVCSDVSGKSAEELSVCSDVSGKSAEEFSICSDVSGKSAEELSVCSDVSGKSTEELSASEIFSAETDRLVSFMVGAFSLPEPETIAMTDSTATPQLTPITALFIFAAGLAERKARNTKMPQITRQPTPPETSPPANPLKADKRNRTARQEKTIVFFFI